MTEKYLLYSLTFLGLFLELAGAFLLSAEAIGSNHLLRIAEILRRRRVISFLIMLFAIVIILILSKIIPILHFFEAIVLILSLGLLNDFAPRIIKILVNRLEKGTLGIIGFILFSIGFTVQAYVNLSLLY